MTSRTQVLHRKILGPSLIPVLDPGWKQFWKHPKNAAYPKPFWWKNITEFLVVHLKLLQCFKLEVWPNSSIDSSCTVQPAQLNMITIYSSSRHGSGENGSLQYLFPFIIGHTPNNTNDSGKSNHLKMHFLWKNGDVPILHVSFRGGYFPLNHDCKKFSKRFPPIMFRPSNLMDATSCNIGGCLGVVHTKNGCFNPSEMNARQMDHFPQGKGLKINKCEHHDGVQVEIWSCQKGWSPRVIASKTLILKKQRY